MENLDELEQRRKRLLYQSWYRGCKETDRILGSYAKRYLAGLSASELDAFETILEETDQDIFHWITGKQAVPARLQSNTILKDVIHMAEKGGPYEQ